MNKIQMEIFGLTSSPHNSGAYSLILQETSGLRRLAILIGADAAQSIVNELEGLKPPRPITHDLLKKVIENLDGHLIEVIIHDLKEGTYFANIIIEDCSEIDSRPSDAIAIALRAGIPIYVTENVLDEAGSLVKDEDETEDEVGNLDNKLENENTQQIKSLSIKDTLEIQLQEAITNEEYELAAKIRDDISKLDPNI
ncbi:MAG: bifunctional nuclease family protein [Chlorobiota bacterium]|nr:bifunctional nuclease family protein [Chlorobiota bacterium]QQS65881.1 MAG: bifunctional nuclease family protein [Chlorobiota bacterium]